MATSTGVYNVGKSRLFDTNVVSNTNLYLALLQPGTITFDPDRDNIDTGTNSVMQTDSNTHATFTNYTTAPSSTYGMQFSNFTTAVTVSANEYDGDTGDNPNSGRWVVAGGSDTNGSIVWSSAGGATNNTISGGVLFWAATPGTPATSDEPIVMYELASTVTTNGSDLTWTWGQSDSAYVLVVLTNVLV